MTGAGRGIGREHALELARHGAAVVVNDYGVSLAGEKADSPADDVVAEIEAMGGRAVANGADVADFADAEAMVRRRSRRTAASTSWSTTPGSCATGCS